MKKLFPLVLLAVLCLPEGGTSQVTGRPEQAGRPSPYFNMNGFYKDSVNSKAFYLKKSRTQRIIGWSMLGGGVAMVAVGSGLFVNNFEIFSNKNDGAAGAGAVMILCGAGCTLGSIPFFISAAHNTKNAARVSMGGQQLLIPEQNNITGKLQPAVRVTIPL